MDLFSLDFFNATPLSIVLWLIPLVAIVIAITIHEFAHALAADRLGDPNPRLQNRLTLNPLRHLDVMGTLMLIFFRFGWGKPVQFDPYNLKNPRRDAALIAFAGPASNLITALICALGIFLINTFTPLGGVGWEIFEYALFSILSISVVLAIFNLIPIFPLDGSHIINAFLSPRASISLTRTMRQVGPFLLILLILPIFGGVAPVSYIVSPIVNSIINLLVPY